MEHNTQVLANEYSKFLKVDTANYVKILEASINETLAHLENYARMVELMKSDASLSVNAILTKKADLLALFEKIRKLEFIVSVVKKNVDEVESMVINAETDLKVTTEGKLRNFFKNVVFKKKSESSSSTPTNSSEFCFIQPQIFSASELFDSVNNIH